MKIAQFATTGNEAGSSVSATDIPVQDAKEIKRALGQVYQLLGSKEVDEEELFAGLVNERLLALSRVEGAQANRLRRAASRFRQELKEELDKWSSVEAAPLERVVKKTLRSLVANGYLTLEEKRAVRDQAFDAAQLDNNPFALYGSEGNDWLKVGSKISQRMVKERLDAFANGELTPLSGSERHQARRELKRGLRTLA
jgi:hypothetical protein